MSVGILIGGQNGDVVWCNREAAEILDEPFSKLMGKPMGIALAQLPMRPSSQEAGLSAVEFDHKGRKLKGTMHVLYGRDGLDEGVVAILEDVTAWHTALQVQQSKLDALNKELKARLSYMENSARFFEKSLDGVQKPWFPQLHENVIRVTKLIETLVQTTLVSNDGFLDKLKPIHLNILVTEVLDELRDEVSQKQIYVKTEIESKMRPIMCQPAHVKTILRELLTNSLRFNRPGGMIQLVAKLQEEAGESFLVLNVSDDGQGIPINDQKKIFDVFYRPEASPESSERNIGVGLAIVHAIVEAYQGRIWFKSQPEMGTLFTILLPAGNLDYERPDEADEFDWVEETSLQE